MDSHGGDPSNYGTCGTVKKLKPLICPTSPTSQIMVPFQKSAKRCILTNPSEKILISQIGSFDQIGVKIKKGLKPPPYITIQICPTPNTSNIPNHPDSSFHPSDICDGCDACIVTFLLLSPSADGEIAIILGGNGKTPSCGGFVAGILGITSDEALR